MYLLYAGGGSAACGALPHFAGRGNFEDLPGDGRLGIRKIKLTGGEPLVRPRMPQLVEKLKNMPGIEKVTLTTNGVLLKDQMSDFARAGLDGLNISLDTLDEPVAGGSRGGMNWGGRWKGFRRQ